jgi:putative hemolysin
MITLAVLVFLIALNGWLSLAEMATVTARRPRLETLARNGHAAARLALRLGERPGTLLSTIQIGMTGITILVGALGEHRLATALSADLDRLFPSLARYAVAISVTLVVVVITFFTVLFGELLPKRLALRRPERMALAVARPLTLLTFLSAPLTRGLDAASETILRLFPGRYGADPPVTDEDLRALVEQGARAGVFAAREPRLVTNVLRLDEGDLSTVMTPRPDVVALDLEDPPELTWQRLSTSPHGRYPVCRGGLDRLEGVVETKRMLLARRGSGPLDLQAFVTPALVLPLSTSPLALLDALARTRERMAIVVDEYGTVEGIATLHDVLEAIVGTLPEDAEDTRMIERTADGGFLIDGATPLEQLAETLERPSLAVRTHGDYHTAAGLVLETLDTIPRVGDRCRVGDVEFVVRAMDRHRIRRLFVRLLPPDT